jgi:hypothetical protein
VHSVFELGKQTPDDVHTRCTTGATTKAMTAAPLARPWTIENVVVRETRP